MIKAEIYFMSGDLSLLQIFSFIRTCVTKPTPIYVHPGKYGQLLKERRPYDNGVNIFYVR